MVDYPATWVTIRSAFSICGLVGMIFFGLCYIVGAAIVGENNSFCLGYWKLNPDHQVYGKVANPLFLMIQMNWIVLHQLLCN
jgi:hypothetical protein